MLTKEQVITKLQSDDSSLIWALRILNQRQTGDEQQQETTRYHNGRGFRPCHARMGTSMAKFFERNGYLSPKQIAYWRKADKSGAMRIAIYWKQIAEEIEVRKAKKAAVQVAIVDEVRMAPAIVEEIVAAKNREQSELDSFMSRIQGA